jgi:hypothetical protein
MHHIELHRVPVVYKMHAVVLRPVVCPCCVVQDITKQIPEFSREKTNLYSSPLLGLCMLGILLLVGINLINEARHVRQRFDFVVQMPYHGIVFCAYKHTFFPPAFTKF